MDFERYNRALDLAARAHSGQFRKSTAVPYLSHPVAVAALVAEYGGTVDQQVAALLHDVLEDAGSSWAAAIRDGFGDDVLRMVEACTDGTPGGDGAKAPWRERKAAYLARLPEEPADALLVAVCDKVANLRSIRQDLERGTAVFERFKGGRDGTLWYYGELSRIFSALGCPAAPELARELQAVQALSADRQSPPPAAGRLEAQLAFLAELEKLKLVSRQNGILDHSRPENSAEHSWHAALLALVLAESAPLCPDGRPLDLARTVSMLLIHDIVEIDAGDNFALAPQAAAAIKISEEQAAVRIFGLLPPDQAAVMLALWHEFEARQSPEARFAAAMDALQPLWNHLQTAPDQHNPQGIRAADLRAWKAHVRETSPVLGDLADDLIRRSVDRGLYLSD
jgi:5'-deoxynucleotidase YfbR-like HD superfamily hydrolase